MICGFGDTITLVIFGINPVEYAIFQGTFVLSVSRLQVSGGKHGSQQATPESEPHRVTKEALGSLDISSQDIKRSLNDASRSCAHCLAQRFEASSCSFDFEFLLFRFTPFSGWKQKPKCCFSTSEAMKGLVKSQTRGLGADHAQLVSGGQRHLQDRLKHVSNSTYPDTRRF
jgi:hypothetical protein